MNRQEFTEMAQHIGHEVKLSLDDDGDINLYCNDCEEIVEVCTVIDCKEDCSDSTRVFITDFNKGKGANE